MTRSTQSNRYDLGWVWVQKIYELSWFMSSPKIIQTNSNLGPVWIDRRKKCFLKNSFIFKLFSDENGLKYISKSIFEWLKKKKKLQFFSKISYFLNSTLKDVFQTHSFKKYVFLNLWYNYIYIYLYLFYIISFIFG